MSTTPEMTGEEASAELMASVFAPAFFDKLASRGVPVSTPEEAREYLQIGQQLLWADKMEAVKQAGSKTAFLKKAGADLQAALNQRYGGAPAAPQFDNYVKQASEMLAADPKIQAAVEAYNAAVAKAGS